MTSGIFTTPRPVPERSAAVLVSGVVLLLALPIFLVADFPFKGWLVAAVLWGSSQVLGLLLARLPLSLDTLAGTGTRGVGQNLRGILVGVVLVVVAAKDETVGLAAIVLYAILFTVEFGLSLVSYFGGTKA